MDLGQAPLAKVKTHRLESSDSGNWLLELCISSGAPPLTASVRTRWRKAADVMEPSGELSRMNLDKT
jgi:hypothetical protein